MIDFVLLIGRLLLVALLYLFLFALMKTGVGMVRGQRRRDKTWTITVERGPKELRGISIAVHGEVIVGRSPDADIVIAASYVSARHARFSVMGKNLFVEDLGSTNGTTLNKQPVLEATPCKKGDLVCVGDVSMRVRLA